MSPFGPRPDSPYDTAFHDAAATRDAALPFEVGPNSEIDGLVIAVGEPYPLRTVRVQAVWPDGADAEDLRIACTASGDEAPPIPHSYILGPPGECAIRQDRSYTAVIKRVRPHEGMGGDLTRPRMLEIEPGSEDVEWKVTLSREDFARPAR